MDQAKLLDQLRVARTLSRLALTEIALVSGLPRWRVQQIFAGSHSAPRPAELRALQRGIVQLERIAAKKKALIANHRKTPARKPRRQPVATP
jgi:hypothetical protein